MNIRQKLDILAAAPDLLEELIAEVPKTMLNMRRIDGKWSIHEHACHLAEAQRMIIGRFKRFKSEKKPTFAPYLPGTTVPDDNLAKMNLQEQLADYRANRKVLIDLLQSYTSEDWTNEGSHPEYSRINPLIWVRHVMMHDHFHMYRIEELWLTTDAYLRKS